MRQIKFRAWHKNNMINNCSVIDGQLSIMENPPKEYDRDPITAKDGQYYYSWATYKNYPDAPLMQFTGLTDKNGVEIYEGDIVKNICGANTKCYWLYVISDESGLKDNNLYAMEFENNLSSEDHRYTYEVEHKKYIRRSHLSSSMFVIGNIHQNPELLEQS